MIGKVQVHIKTTNYEPFYEVNSDFYMSDPNRPEYIGSINVSFEIPADMAADIAAHIAIKTAEGGAEAVPAVKGKASKLGEA